MNEAVKPPQSANRLVSWPEVQVVGVAQDRLDTNLYEFFGGEGFNRSLCSHGKKGRGSERAVVRFNPPQPSLGGAILFDDLEAKSHLSLRQCQMSKLKV